MSRKAFKQKRAPVYRRSSGCMSAPKWGRDQPSVVAAP